MIDGLMRTRATDPWRAPRLWLLLQSVARVVLAPFARLRVTGDVPAALRGGPLILAANHVSPVDPVVLTAATRVRRIAPRIMATGGLFRTPVVGHLMRACGHIRVDRRTDTVARALDDAGDALVARSVVMLYPEGRIGLDPGLWPERGKTGAARLALAAAAPVIPVAQWGAHEMVPYSAPHGAGRGLLRALLRRPVVRVHFGAPVDLSGLRVGAPGHAQQATDRIIDALTAALAPLRPDEPDTPRHVDPTRPVSTARSHRHVVRAPPTSPTTS
jgi:1-acyl-sn-glycerol-3-phosphate acyltransferase